MLIGVLSGAFSGATCLRSNCRIDRDFPSSIAVPIRRLLVFLLQEFGTIPTIGDRIDVKGWRFEIVDLDGRRIDKVLVSWLGASINA